MSQENKKKNPAPARNARTALGVLAIAIAAMVAWIAVRPAVYDYVITDVRYLRHDTITEDEFTVGIQGEKIAYIGHKPLLRRHTVSGKGLILVPGFIDTNAGGWVYGEGAARKLFDGITTYLNAHGDMPGGSAEFYRFKTYLNYANTVGIITFKDRIDLPGFDLMDELEQGLKLGAYGIAFSPEYTPIATAERIKKVCEHFSAKNILISFHARYSDHDRELAGIKEVLNCARKGSPIHILHITSTGATFHQRQAVDLIHEEQSRGNRVLFDFFPYTSWASSVNRARFEGNWRKRYRVDYHQLRLAGKDEPMTAESFALLQKQNNNRSVMVDAIPRGTVDYFALQTDAGIGTDSPAQSDSDHPRGAGSFAKFINDYVDTGKIPLEKALYRLSTLACERFAPYIPGLRERGKIEEGYYADLVLWDRGSIKSTSTAANPLSISRGVVAAFVNGSPLILNRQARLPGKDTGKFLRGNLATGLNDRN